MADPRDLLTPDFAKETTLLAEDLAAIARGEAVPPEFDERGVGPNIAIPGDTPTAFTNLANQQAQAKRPAPPPAPAPAPKPDAVSGADVPAPRPDAVSGADVPAQREQKAPQPAQPAQVAPGVQEPQAAPGTAIPGTIEGVEHASLDEAAKAAGSTLRAERQAAEATATAEQQLAEQERQAQEELRRQADHIEAIQAQQSAIHQKLEELANERIDPNRAFQGPRGVAAAIAVLAGGMLRFRTGGVNRALEALDRIAERDIAAQQADLARRGQILGQRQRLYAQMLQTVKDAQAAQLLAKGAAMAQIGHTLKAQLAKIDATSGVAAKGHQLLQAIYERAREYMLAGRERALQDATLALQRQAALAKLRGSGSSASKLALPGAQELKEQGKAFNAETVGLVIKDARGNTLPVVAREAIGETAPARDDAINLVRDGTETLQLVRWMKEIVQAQAKFEKSGEGIFSRIPITERRAAWQRLRSLIASINLGNKLTSPGASKLSDEDIKILKKAEEAKNLESFLKVFDSPEAMLDRLNVVEQNIRKKVLNGIQPAITVAGWKAVDFRPRLRSLQSVLVNPPEQVGGRESIVKGVQEIKAAPTPEAKLAAADLWLDNLKANVTAPGQVQSNVLGGIPGGAKVVAEGMKEYLNAGGSRKKLREVGQTLLRKDPTLVVEPTFAEVDPTFAPLGLKILADKVKSGDISAEDAKAVAKAILRQERKGLREVRATEATRLQRILGSLPKPPAPTAKPGLKDVGL